MSSRRRIATALLLAVAVVAVLPVAAQAPKAGVVVMHGKGGLPDGVVLELAQFLEARFLVANLEMPWSSRRDYDVDVSGGNVASASDSSTTKARAAFRP